MHSTSVQSELWMGTHHLLPSALHTGEPLSTIVGNLPYLFKVLSVQKPLSIQLHPDKPTAVKLHSQDPSHYPDDNHKPEMTLSLTEFHLLYGFRKRREIIRLFTSIPKLRKLISSHSLVQLMLHKDISYILSDIFLATSYKDAIHALIQNKETSALAGFL